VRIDKITIKGLTTYREEQTLDLAAIGPGIIAVAGPNGSGKTTLLEAIPGGLYRQTPSRGNIASIATARDARVELVGENGAPFAIRLDIDSHTGKQEAVIMDAFGESLAGPKVRDFDAYVSGHMPPLDVYLASFFASQTGAGSVLKMSRSDRRALFGRLLGLDQLEEMATAAREKARAVETDMATTRAALDAIKAGAGDVIELERQLAKARENEAAAAEVAKAAEAKYQAAIAECDRLETLAKDAEKTSQAARDARGKALEAKAIKHGIESRLKALDPILSLADEIRTVSESLRKAESSLLALEGEARAAEAAEKAAADRVAEALRKFKQAQARETEIGGKLKALAAILMDAPKIRMIALELDAAASEIDIIRQAGEDAASVERQAQEAVDMRRREYQEAAKAHDSAARDLADARARAIEAKKRLAAAEQSTSSVPCAGSLDDVARAGCPALVGHFRTRDESRKVIDDIEARVPDLTKAADNALAKKCSADSAEKEALRAKVEANAKTIEIRSKYRDLRENVERLRAADRSAELTRAEAEAGILKQNHHQAAAAAAEADEEWQGLSMDHHSAMQVSEEKRERLSWQRREISELRDADRMKALEDAERQAAELKGRLDPARTAVEETEAEAVKLEALVVPVDWFLQNCADDALKYEDGNRRTTIETLKEAGNQVARIEVQLTAAQAAQDKAQALMEKLAPMEADLAEWRWLGRGLGREGVQALELDAAGPQVATLANELLADAYGPRFQLRFETQAAMASGKGVKETFDIVVVDTERGREGNGEDLSGGEKVIVGEALGLAVGLFHAQAAGVNLGTVVRDETVGALDPENAERYIAMLRSFLRVGKVHQLLYVAHSPALVDMADAVVRVEDGRIQVN
jgi:DNA repair protein SbcC/Rad50